MKLYFLLFFFFCSCGQNITHSNDLIYYTTIEKTITSSSQKVNAYWDRLMQGMVKARQSSNYKLDSAVIDSFQKSLLEISAFLSEQIQTIKAIKETDKEIALKDTVISYLQHTKEMQDGALPITFNLLSIGLDKVTDLQKQTLHNFYLQAQILLKKTSEIKDQTLKYKNKHNITDYELTKYGL